jgi:hypothetical protein
LGEACDDYVTSEANKIAERLKNSSVNPAFDASLEEILDLVAELDYDGAKEKIDSLLKQEESI